MSGCIYYDRDFINLLEQTMFSTGYDVLRERLHLSRKSNSLGYSVLSRSDLVLPSRPADTMFLLGSGGSINDLSDENFATIREQESIGINAWAIHPFVPSAYSFEFSKTPGPPGPERHVIQNRLCRPEVLERSPKLLFLRPAGPAHRIRSFSLHPSLRGEARIYGRFALPRNRPISISREMRRIFRAYSAGLIPFEILLDNGASVARLLTLSLLSGFKRVVLVGVDLGDSQYFWQEPSRVLFDKGVTSAFPRTKTSVHRTMEVGERAISISDFIGELSIIASEQFHAKIFVGSDRSLLSNTLPVYDW